MEFSKLSKAIAGAVGATAASVATAAVVTGSAGSISPVAIPAGVSMPWYGYVIVGLANALLVFATVYFAPRNKV